MNRVRDYVYGQVDGVHVNEEGKSLMMANSHSVIGSKQAPPFAAVRRKSRITNLVTDSQYEGLLTPQEELWKVVATFPCKRLIDLDLILAIATKHGAEH